MLLSCHGVSASPRGGINPSFCAQNGAGFLSNILKETKTKFRFPSGKESLSSFWAQKGVDFLLDAKRNKSGKGLFSERGPRRKKFRWGICAPCNPKTPHTPTNGKRARGKNPPPYLRGQFVNKRKKRNTSKKEVETINRVCFFAIKADGKECSPLFVNFNLTLLSRARKILQP